MSTRIWMTQMIQYAFFSLLKYVIQCLWWSFVVFCLFADLSVAAGSVYKSTSVPKSQSSITTEIKGNYLATIKNNQQAITYNFSSENRLLGPYSMDIYNYFSEWESSSEIKQKKLVFKTKYESNSPYVSNCIFLKLAMGQKECIYSNSCLTQIFY